MKNSRFPDLKPHHVGISVENIQESIDFWTQIMGFEIDFKKDIKPIKAKIAFLKREGFRIELFEIENSATVPEYSLKPNTDLTVQGTKHVCFSVKNVQSVLDDLFEQGIKIVGVMRGESGHMQIEDDPRLQPDDKRHAASAFFLLAPSNILIEILSQDSFD